MNERTLMRFEGCEYEDSTREFYSRFIQISKFIEITQTFDPSFCTENTKIEKVARVCVKVKARKLYEKEEEKKRKK